MHAQTLVRAMARALTGYTYITLGYDSFRAPGRRVEVVETLLAKVNDVVPVSLDAEALVKVSGMTQASAGVLLASGILPRWAALAIFGTMVPTTLAGHAYWNVEDPELRGAQRVQFRKNMALLGGLLFCALDSKGFWPRRNGG